MMAILFFRREFMLRDSLDEGAVERHAAAEAADDSRNDCGIAEAIP
jgi:hypothetical protein